MKGAKQYHAPGHMRGRTHAHNIEEYVKYWFSALNTIFKLLLFVYIVVFQRFAFCRILFICKVFCFNALEIKTQF